MFMPVEQDFLSKIEAHPDKRNLYRAYANWLVANNDPRAELIFIEEEMRQIPIYSDRYWELKPGRNALRDEYEKTWLKQMGYGVDYEPVFYDVPDGWKERWRLLREFVERWHQIPLGDVGGHAEDIEKTEKSLGMKLPPSVKEWIAFCSELIDLSVYGKLIRDCFEVEHLKDLSAISLMLQGEADFYWAIKEENLGAFDPPVDGYNLDYDNEKLDHFVHYGLFAPRITSFVFDYLTSYLHGAGGGFSTTIKTNDELIQSLNNAFPFRSQIDNVRVFEKRNIIVLLGSSGYAPDETHLRVEVWDKASVKDVPAFLWNYTQHGGCFHGKFADELK